eukprot:6812-Heterococcus_DN1.PRE.3
MAAIVSLLCTELEAVTGDCHSGDFATSTAAAAAGTSAALAAATAQKQLRLSKSHAGLSLASMQELQNLTRPTSHMKSAHSNLLLPPARTGINSLHDREETVPELRRKLKSLAAQLTDEQRRVASLRAGTTSQILHRAELEDFFVRCIEASHNLCIPSIC